MNDLENVPISGATAVKPELLRDLATVSRTTEMPVITHYNIRRTIDLYGATQGRDLGVRKSCHQQDSGGASQRSEEG